MVQAYPWEAMEGEDTFGESHMFYGISTILGLLCTKPNRFTKLHNLFQISRGKRWYFVQGVGRSDDISGWRIFSSDEGGILCKVQGSLVFFLDGECFCQVKVVHREVCRPDTVKSQISAPGAFEIRIEYLPFFKNLTFLFCFFVIDN